MFEDLEPPYGCICADPPWGFRARTALQMSNWTSRRDAEKHYKVMGIDDIAALPVRDLAAKDCHLFMWVTGPIMVEGKYLQIMKAWGFRPSAVAFTWIKTRRGKANAQFRLVASNDIESLLHVGLGLTTRKNAEFCLLGRRGNAKRNAKNIREIIMAPVREHSRKPDEYRRRVDAYVGPGIRTLELFSRESWSGVNGQWDTWGLEAGKFDGATEPSRSPVILSATR